MVNIGQSTAFFDALGKLTPAEVMKALDAMQKFQRNPQQAGLNFETLNACKDDKLRSIRVNQDVRIILAKTDEDDLYLFLYVDHHEKAYRWAENRKVQVNRATGNIQVFNVIDEQELRLKDPSTPQVEAGLFDGIKDKHLLQMSIPEESIGLVRRMTIEADLDNAKDNDQLPEEAYEALFMIMSGSSVDEVLDDLFESSEVAVPAAVVDLSFRTALKHPASLSKFVVSENETELAELLSDNLEKWRIFLHSTQRKLVDKAKNGPVRVLGGAGTGKTVVAMHRAKWLVEHVATGQQKILFTTFTRNLAKDIQMNLSKLCSKEVLAKIEVVNFDSWVMGFLKSTGYDYKLLLDGSEKDRLWQTAYSEKPADIDFNPEFFKEEWDMVIQPQSVMTADDYRSATRIGRGTRLNRPQRMALWPVFDEYRRQLQFAQMKEVDDIYRDARTILSSKGALIDRYCSVIVDEAQDMGSQAFMLLRAIVPESTNDMFIVGDGHQRIYGKNKVVLGQCGINIKGRSARLRINYRTTEETRKVAVAILEGVSVDDLDGGEDTQQAYHSLVHGPQPEQQCFQDEKQQALAIKQLLDRPDVVAGECCVVARTNRELAKIHNQLQALGVEVQILDKHFQKSTSNVLNLASMHRVKGLEFDIVFLASANRGVIPLDIAVNSGNDAVSRRQRENEERALVYVSLTRARKQAYVLGYGEMSKWFGGK